MPLAGIFGLCIFMKFTSMKKRLAVLGMLLDIVDRRVSLPDIEFMQVVVIDARDLDRGLARGALPFK